MSAPPGWYPVDPKREGWWDGYAWTGRTRRARRETFWEGAGRLAVGCMLVLLVVVVLALVVTAVTLAL